MRIRTVLLLLAGGAASCGGPAPPASALDRLETRFDSTRYLADQVSITEARGADTSAHGVPLGRLRAELAAGLAGLLAAGDSVNPEPADTAAVAAIRRWVETAARPRAADSTEVLDCGYQAGRLAAGPEPLRRLGRRIFACYTAATRRVIVDRDTLDRLTALSLLATTEDRGRRERIFRALDTVWASVNGHDEPGSPYRTLVPLRRAAWGDSLTPMARRGLAFGIPADTVERWLVRALEAWRRVLPPEPVEPWDYYYQVGAASRRLGPRIGKTDLLAINHRFYRALGADPDALGVRYDLEPRAGKYPIAFSDFGGRPRLRDGRWGRIEPWVFASYRIGGFGNLNELLHETGHAIHIAAIRTRPAFADWPDSDTFTEAIAELATWEMFEPAWQARFLGDSAPLIESLRDKYAGIMLDVAWALFEFRVHRPGAPSPNAVWSEITSAYLGIKPHPEWSWWAMRGQLIESPGYLLNYALGAFLVADLRAALIRRFGPFTLGQPGWYRQVSEAIYRFGRERPAAEIVREVLGRAPAAEALLADLGRMGGGGK